MLDGAYINVNTSVVLNRDTWSTVTEFFSQEVGGNQTHTGEAQLDMKNGQRGAALNRRPTLTTSQLNDSSFIVASLAVVVRDWMAVLWR